jgi:alpha-beta hydrolase superfamily lysophospholipase
MGASGNGEGEIQLTITDQEMAQELPSKRRWWLIVAGLVIVLAGAFLAQLVRTTDGTTVRDIRFTGTNGTVMTALLYVPKNATPSTPAPGILAVHGYINSRETQDGFAIEFARRGYVVLSLDQTGHGYSGGAAFSNGFGGPDGLKYLRSLPMVDTNQIGLEGHSMGGWAVLAAAAAMPDAYSSMVLEGSSTGAPLHKKVRPPGREISRLCSAAMTNFRKSCGTSIAHRTCRLARSCKQCLAPMHPLRRSVCMER